MLISMPQATSFVFGAVQAIVHSPRFLKFRLGAGWPSCKCDVGRMTSNGLGIGLA